MKLLNLASVGALRKFFVGLADHPSRVWVVTDYEADPQLPWRRVITLD